MLTGRHAVITGGGRGIGAAIALALAGESARVSLLGRDAETLRTQLPRRIRTARR